MTSTTTPTRGASVAPSVATNRDIAVDFLRQAASGHAQEVMRRYAAPDFVHHNPHFASDADTLARAMDDNARADAEKTLEVLRTISEGSLVAVHSRVQHKPGDVPVATVHIFRIEDGRIAELWDLGQETPADSPNQAGMF